MRNINKQDCNSAKLVKQYLSLTNKLPEELYHYTSYQALVSILLNKSFQMSRADLLNDKAETRLGYATEHRRSYVMSFTEETEYVSMWTMYGKSIGVKMRLGIDRKKFESLLKEENIWYKDENGIRLTIQNKTKPLFEISPRRERIMLSKVAYYDVEKEIIYDIPNSKPFPVTVDKSLINELTGVIKYSAWEAERETRARVVLDSHIPTIDIPYLYIGLSEEIIESFEITFNPWIPEDMRHEIEGSLNRLAGRKLAYKQSKLKDQIDESILHS